MAVEIQILAWDRVKLINGMPLWIIRSQWSEDIDIYRRLFYVGLICPITNGYTNKGLQLMNIFFIIIILN
jgi:hypothetical protein